MIELSIARPRAWYALTYALTALSLVVVAFIVAADVRSSVVAGLFAVLAVAPLYARSRVLQKELASTRERLRDFIQLSEDFVWEGDADAVYTFASPRSRDILGRGPEEIIGRRPPDLMDEDDAKRMEALIAVHHAEQKPFIDMKKTSIRNDGRRVHVQTTATPIFDDDGRFMGFRGIDRDITGREDDRDNLVRLGTAIEAACDAIVITDREGVIEYVNPAFERITGYLRSEVLGHTPRILKSGRQADDVYVRLWCDLRLGKRWSGHFVNKRKDGSFYDAEVTISPIWSREHAINGFVAVQRDVTEHVALLDRLRDAEEMKRLGRLVAGVAHEVRNPLNAIQVAAATLELDHAEAGSKPLFGIVHAQVDRLTKLMNDLLEIGKPVGDTEACSAKQLCLEALAVWRGAHIKDADRVRLQIPERFEARVRIDSVRMQQVLINLLDNAVQHAPGEGRVVLGCDANDLEVRIFVADGGPGLDAEAAERMFEPFFTKRRGGTGLGLSIVKNVVERHGGHVFVRNRDDAPGAIAEVFLPADHGSGR